jgi:tryptophan-rich sensory protein
VRTWRRFPAQVSPARSGFLLVCLLHALLNVLWSVLYFTLRRPDWALIEGVALWFTAAWAATLMLRVDRFSGLLMLPLLLWLGIAWALNAATVWLNPPFGA